MLVKRTFLHSTKRIRLIKQMLQLIDLKSDQSFLQGIGEAPQHPKQLRPKV